MGDPIQIPQLTAFGIAVAAIVSAFGVIISPLLMAWLLDRNQARAKQKDYERQDAVAKRLLDRQDLADKRTEEVAEQAKEVARQQAAHADEVARRLAENTAKQDAVNREKTSKLDQIHVLVNSGLTAALEGQMEYAVANLALMEDNIARLRSEGKRPSEQTLVLIDHAKAKIVMLAAQLRERSAAEAAIAEKERLDPSKQSKPNG